jgi:hypothetical protein
MKNWKYHNHLICLLHEKLKHTPQQKDLYTNIHNSFIQNTQSGDLSFVISKWIVE